MGLACLHEAFDSRYCRQTQWKLPWNCSVFIVSVWYSFRVGTGTALRAGWRSGGSSSRGRVKNFHFSRLSRPVLGPTQHGYRGLFLRGGVKRQAREADHSPATSTETKKTWYLYIFMVQYLVICRTADCGQWISVAQSSDASRRACAVTLFCLSNNSDVEAVGSSHVPFACFSASLLFL
jgi:hypothetical protein